jgi:hypothetical protein
VIAEAANETNPRLNRLLGIASRSVPAGHFTR